MFKPPGPPSQPPGPPVQPPGPPGRPSQPNPQLLQATQLVIQVARDIEEVLTRARPGQPIRINERRLRGWQLTLRQAVTLLRQIPVIQIYPPPPFARQINRAVQRIEEAIATLASIPIGSTRIYPPQPGWALVPPRVLRSVLNDLNAALRNLYRAAGQA